MRCSATKVTMASRVARTNNATWELTVLKSGTRVSPNTSIAPGSGLLRIPFGPPVTEAKDWAVSRAASVRLSETIAK